MHSGLFFFALLLSTDFPEEIEMVRYIICWGEYFSFSFYVVNPIGFIVL
jgi:hypothetical protein